MPLTLHLSLSLVAMLVGATTTFGCSPSRQIPASSTTAGVQTVTAPAAAPVQFTRLVSLSTSGFAEPVELVLRDKDALSTAWQTLYNGIPGNPAPVTDLARSVVIILALGTRSTGGYTIRADSVTADRSGNSTVFYRVTSPGPQCMATQIITSPVDVISIPRLAGSVRFSQRNAIENC